MQKKLQTASEILTSAFPFQSFMAYFTDGTRTYSI
jgi:hypothetical protein